MRWISILLFLFESSVVTAQTNCLVYQDSAHKRACELYQQAVDHPQGSRVSQSYFLESLKVCPTFAPSLYEMAVPYLKNGDFLTWKFLIDKAVKESPQFYLTSRASDLFFFLRDYSEALKDLKKAYQLTNGFPGYSVNGNYDLRVVMALCYFKLGHNKKALTVYDECIKDNLAHDRIGLYEYLHRGVIHLKLKNYQKALADLTAETIKYEKLADTYYYLGVAYLKINDRKSALINFRKAKGFYLQGYHLSDTYNEMPDQVYLSDIEERLNDRLSVKFDQSR